MQTERVKPIGRVDAFLQRIRKDYDGGQSEQVNGSIVVGAADLNSQICGVGRGRTPTYLSSNYISAMVCAEYFFVSSSTMGHLFLSS